MPLIIDGKKVAATVDAETAERVAALAAAGTSPGLAVVLVGDDPASQKYVGMKGRACARLGITSFDHRLPADASQAEVNAVVERLDADPAVHGILVQMPLPRHLDAEQVIERISADKDVDGFGAAALGRLVRGLEAPRACTPHGVMKLLEAAEVSLSGKRAVVIGRSTIVGKPLALLLLEADATVTVCHSRTADLPAVCREADVLVAAVGRPGLVTADFVKPGAVVIDVGSPVGDVDFDAVAPIASAITPVPGGVGPMTIAMLMHNTVTAAERAAGRA